MKGHAVLLYGFPWRLPTRLSGAVWGGSRMPPLCSSCMPCFLGPWWFKLACRLHSTLRDCLSSSGHPRPCCGLACRVGRFDFIMKRLFSFKWIQNTPKHRPAVYNVFCHQVWPHSWWTSLVFWSWVTSLPSHTFYLDSLRVLQYVWAACCCLELSTLRDSFSVLPEQWPVL